MAPDTPVVLAVDTSHQVAVGLARGGEVLATLVVADPRAHVEQLTPSVTDCLAAAGLGIEQVGSVVIGLGPGPFTGLRVGIVTGWTLAATRGIGWEGVCSLDVIARQWPDDAEVPDDFVVCSDARRSEVYWARYRDGARVDGPHVAAPGELPDLPTTGPGVEHHAEHLGDRVIDGPRALDPGVMAAIGWQLPSAGAEPLYLRRPDATEPGRRKSALPTGPRLLRGLTPRAGQEQP